MKNIETGGPAFPTIDYIRPDKIATNQGGMTLRDYFAAKAMQGILSNPVYFASLQESAIELDKYGHPTDLFRLASELSWEMADAMLEARK